MLAQREAVAVSSHGQVTGYFVGPDDYEAFKRAGSRMDPRHAHLDALLDPK
jgi:hypothetical protein